ncbi:inverse autotransporter beta domain-containing protein [Morganella sp. GD04133]|uniref:inverse autotransporter beta domain-containing protein n=1 Tax=Morganella sp. GD04133 TaxID=2975435 RepID=UPI00244D77A7|nr:inverse autotransporter beta domain-containing protein [Morganella sp. GD04133]MDH0354027.1 inverse autotransporter beta domain-containing protein [Morganella sp. GD04133]
MSSTIAGMNTLLSHGNPVSPEQPEVKQTAADDTSPAIYSGAQNHPSADTIQDVSRDNTIHQDNLFSTLPSLGLADTAEENGVPPETRMAQGISQAGQLLSADNVTDSTVGYARSIGENLLNQQVNDWLNQVGHARIQFGSNKTGDADVLVPLIDNPDSLLFSQVGLRANDERTTTNLGLGYRQYEDGWMWGVNSFYDYDITGSNSRVGVGGELWANYLKLAANGYFRVTDWHQSSLHEMRDYDERPANGFDIRAEGYLPDYPQLGAFAKYEQYFGDGISLAGTTASGELKSNPSVSTLGLSYTPFPLITFKGQTSRGDSNDSRVGMELSYRFGVPLSQQTDTGNVDLMRNLAGNRYDFVDRNYNIVMQYRKQELLRIALPPSLRGEASQTQPVTVSVLKAKYGLKSLRWSAPELLANGGEIKQTGLTTADITLPPYIFADRSGEPQGYRVTAVGEDNEGNPSNTAEMWVNVIPSAETVTQLTVTPNQSLVANNSDQFTAVALLQNDKGEVLPDKAVTFSFSGLKNPEGVTIYDADGNNGQTLTVNSGPDGTATVKIISKSAGKGLLKAGMRNGNSRSETITYIADISSAKIKTLELINNKAVADGQSKNIAVATITDQFDNPAEGLTLTADVTNGAVIDAAQLITDELGQVTIPFTSTTAGQSVLTVNSNINTRQVTSEFIADVPAEGHSGITVDNTTYTAGEDIRVTVTLKDEHGNAVSGEAASLADSVSVPNAEHSAAGPWTETGNSGVYQATYTAATAGTGLTAVLRLSTWNTPVSSGTYAITAGDAAEGQARITVDNTTYTAGEDIRVTVTLKDEHGNAVSGEAASLADSVSVPNAEHSAAGPWTETGNSGVYQATYTAATAGTGLTAVLRLSTWNTPVSSGTYAITAGDAAEGQARITVDNTTYTAGEDIRVTVTLKDEHGNAVSGEAASLADSVSVPNAEHSAAGPWTETGNSGVYQATYTAATAGTGLTAVLRLSTWNTPVSSGTYAITAGDAAEGQARITVDNTTYTAGEDIRVTVTLKDEHGNAVSGEAASLADSVSVPNAEHSAAGPWTETGNSGVYQATYTAATAGTGLTAVLRLSTWNTPVSSGTYAITAGDAAEGQARITVDNTTYTAGEDIRVTVTLKDEHGNAVSGEAASLADSVSVPNAEHSAAGPWTETGNSGVYQATYTAATAGTGLTAVLRLSTWNTPVSSGTYAITAGLLSGEKSEFTADKNLLIGSDRYMDGDTETQLYLTATDDYGNTISGASERITFKVKSSQSTSLNINTDVFIDNVTESAPGMYTATMRFNEEHAPDIYTVIPQYDNADATPLNTLITLKPSYPEYIYNGQNDIPSTLAVIPDSFKGDGLTKATVLQTLVDKHGNNVPGVTRGIELRVSSNLSVDPEGVTLTPVTDNGDGTYTGYLTGTIPGRYAVYGGLLDSFEAGFTVTPDDPIKTQSAIKVDNSIYMTGDEITVTVTLKNQQGKPLIGYAELLTEETVTVRGAIAGTDTSWQDDKNGTYHRTYQATTPGDNLAASLLFTGWSSAIVSSRYQIKAETFKAIRVNGADFEHSATRMDAGFINATFELIPRKGTSHDYQWEASANWLTVNNGVVTFHEQPETRQIVTITATPKYNTRPPITFKFDLFKWMINEGSRHDQTFHQINYKCRNQMNGRFENSTRGVRSPDGEIVEFWGPLLNYSNTGLVDGVYGSALPSSGKLYNSWHPNEGRHSSWDTPGDTLGYFMCVLTLK